MWRRDGREAKRQMVDSLREGGSWKGFAERGGRRDDDEIKRRGER